MDPITQQQALATAGAAGSGERLYAEDLFAATTYTGTGSQQTITTGIDIAGEGGFVWIKSRSAARSPYWYDDELGKTGTYYDHLMTRSTNAPNTGGLGGITSFNSDGFTIDGTNNNNNEVGATYVAWSFRKAPGFMTSVKYTGNSTLGRTVSHDLDSVPGMIIVKRLDNTGDWMVYHKGMGRFYGIELNDDTQRTSSSGWWNNTDPTSTEFTLGNDADVNTSGGEYIAYLFADDDQRFGSNSDESVISCPFWSDDAEVDLGWEPQWVMTRQRNAHSDSQHWNIFDSLRGIIYGTQSPVLKADVTDAESADIELYPQATGFDAVHPFYGRQWMGLSVRRAHKPPTAATEVLDIISRSGTSTNTVVSSNTGLVDFALVKSRTTTNRSVVASRVMGNYTLTTSENYAESTGVFGSSINPWDSDGVEFRSDGDTNSSNAAYTYINYFLRRAPGFFDIVAYEGTGSATTINHSLGAVPKMMMVKKRDSAESWSVYHEAYGNNKNLWLNDSSGGITSARWNNTTPTDSVFSVGTDTGTNTSAADYIAYLFGDVSGISKVGSYTGTGGNIDIDCGFSAGARFVLIKRYGGTGGWFVWDTTRSIVSGNDPYIVLDTSAAEITNTDYIDPLNAGFTVTSTAPADLNASGGTYLFLAIA